MCRPALVSLVVLVGAGWGAPALGQELPANAGAVLAGGAEPDTTAPWRYYPLAVGNVWEYRSQRGVTTRKAVVGDTTVGGVNYFFLERVAFDTDGTPSAPFVQLVRYDSTFHVDRERYTNSEGEGVEGLGEVPCPLDSPFDIVVTFEGRDCAVRGDYDVSLVFGGVEPGTGADTVRTAVKEFAFFTGLVERFAAGVGLVLSDLEGVYQALRYYRIDGEEHGVVLFPVSNVSTPPLAGAALTIGPNPTGGAATVRLGLPAPADVRVAVYDVLGRRVATLASGALAAGTHGLPLDAAPLAPGVYVVRAEVGGGAVLVRRVTVAR